MYFLKKENVLIPRLTTPYPSTVHNSSICPCQLVGTGFCSFLSETEGHFVTKFPPFLVEGNALNF